ncbi:MAG: transcription antitermination factor NusB [Oscillospiraceae bacterium]|nr:transcription antitermination factor NusB [Oscillospiraceae bacterium]
MSRIKAREIVLCLVFEKDYRKDRSCEKLYEDLFEDLLGDIFEKEDIDDNDEEYIKDAFFGVFEHTEQIDDIVSGAITGWEYNRISKISMALLRIAVYEMLYTGDVSPAVAVNEAVELSKRYDGAEAHAFVNGVLRTVSRQLTANK